ncbi:MAG: hypothetical protein ACTSU9_02460, partial [Promethearchaeota archaeon]
VKEEQVGPGTFASFNDVNMHSNAGFVFVQMNGGSGRVLKLDVEGTMKFIHKLLSLSLSLG